MAAVLRTNGVTVELKIFPNESHAFQPNQGVLFRSIGEYCLVHFKGADAFSNYESILAWQTRAKPLWVFWLPAFLWAGWWWRSRTIVAAEVTRLKSSSESRVPSPEFSVRASLPRLLLSKHAALRWLAGILAALAIGQTMLHLGTPRLAISERTLNLARKHLVQSKELKDFEFLAAKPCWSGKRLRTLLEHVELANYNRELVNWKWEDEVYRDFVLSPEIDPVFDGELNWRRSLWENFYPRIRHENDPASAAEIVVRFLRERVTISDQVFQSQSIAAIWEQELTNAAGFERIYVAALRSVGVAARINGAGRAEMWSDRAWVAAPRPWRW